MWKRAGIATGGGMGKQLNYYMGYDEFITVYLSTNEITKKWMMPLRDWGKVLGELEIMYPDRLG